MEFKSPQNYWQIDIRLNAMLQELLVSITIFNTPFGMRVWCPWGKWNNLNWIAGLEKKHWFTIRSQAFCTLTYNGRGCSGGIYRRWSYTTYIWLTAACIQCQELHLCIWLFHAMLQMEWQRHFPFHCLP